MAHPILLLGLGLGAVLAWAKRGSAAAVPATTDAALIDPSEKTHPNAETARLAIVNSMTVNSVTLYEMTAKAIETQLKMPKTAGHLRAWSTMAQQGGHTIAGEEDAGDEVGARRRRRRRRRARRPSAASRAVVRQAAASSPVLASLVSYGDSSPSDAIDFGDEEEGGDEDEEVGAAAPRRLAGAGPKRLPDWLRFNATQAVLAGDPRFIRATAELMRGMGYPRHAEIHLRALGRGRSI